jgi:hypothetical protein
MNATATIKLWFARRFATQWSCNYLRKEAARLDARIALMRAESSEYRAMIRAAHMLNNL